MLVIVEYLLQNLQHAGCAMKMFAGLILRSVQCYWQLYKTTVAIFEGCAA